MNSKKYRDASSGRYVSEEYAKRHPKTTVGETVKQPAKHSKRK